MGHVQGIGIILCHLQTFLLDILWDHFITVKATLKIPFHWVPLNIMLVLKR